MDDDILSYLFIDFREFLLAIDIMQLLYEMMDSTRQMQYIIDFKSLDMINYEQR